MKLTGSILPLIDDRAIIESALAVLDLSIIKAINLVTCQLVVSDAEQEILSKHAASPTKIVLVRFLVPGCINGASPRCRFRHGGFAIRDVLGPKRWTCLWHGDFWGHLSQSNEES